MSEFVLPGLHPVKQAGDYWEVLRAGVPHHIVAPSSWKRLASVAPMLPNAAFGIERSLDSAAIIQFGCHIWPWHLQAALDRAAQFPAAAFLAPHIHAWRAATQTDEPRSHFMVMWDALAGAQALSPQIFLSFQHDSPNWRERVHAFADRLDPSMAPFTKVWRQCADSPYSHVLALAFTARTSRWWDA